MEGGLDKIGPFVCEWHNIPLTGEAHLADMTDEKTPADKRNLRALGWCSQCGRETWSAGVLVDASKVNTQEIDDQSSG